MKFVSWNVNGLRACMNKGFMDFFKQVDADIFAIQETKMKESQKEFHIEGYYEYWNSADKAGYSGTLILAKKKPLRVIYGTHQGLYNDEGRIITLEYETFYFITVYVPNAQRELTRLDYRMDFEDQFRQYLNSLDKPIVLCGDLNVAHKVIDLKNPKANEKNAGYTIEERTKFQQLLDSGFIDSFRHLYPQKIEYTWWSYMMQAREKNIGWRIDYFLVSSQIKNQISDCKIHTHIYGSDHCPVELHLL
jgi:exodeoxyribonuclease-3